MSEITNNIESNGGSPMQILIQQAQMYISEVWSDFARSRRYTGILERLGHYSNHRIMHYKCMRHENCHDMHFHIRNLFEGYASISMYAADMKHTRKAFIIDLYKVNFLVPDGTEMIDDLPEIISHAWRISIEVLNGKFIWTIDKTYGRDVQGRIVMESESLNIKDITFDGIVGFESGFINTFAFADNQEFASQFTRWLADTFEICDFLPILKYLRHDFQLSYMSSREFWRDVVISTASHAEHKRVYQILKDRKGTKDCLNAIYDPSGQKRLTKNAFGGLGEIRDLYDLLNAAVVVEALSPFEAEIFEAIDLNNVSGLWSHFVYEALLNGEHYHKVIKFFGVKEKTLNAILRLLYENKFRSHNTLMQIHDLILQIEGYLDSGDSYEKEAAAVIAKAAVDRFNADQDFIVVSQLISEEIRRIKNPNVPVEGEFYDRVDGYMITPEIKVVTPKMTHDLLTWGAEQNSCIGNYINAVRNAECYIIGFQKPNGKWWGHAQIDCIAMLLMQLRGHSNADLPQDAHTDIVMYLKSIGVKVLSYVEENEPF